MNAMNARRDKRAHTIRNSSKPEAIPRSRRSNAVSTESIDRYSGKVDVEQVARHTLNHRHQASDETAALGDAEASRSKGGLNH